MMNPYPAPASVPFELPILPNIVWYLLGVAASILLPYLMTYVATPQKFDWRYLVGRLLASVAGLIAFLTLDQLANINAMPAWAAFASGFVFSQLGRMTDKLVTAKAMPQDVEVGE